MRKRRSIAAQVKAPPKRLGAASISALLPNRVGVEAAPMKDNPVLALQEQVRAAGRQ